MENQPAEKRGEEDGSIRDRISNLPEPLLHNALSHLTQKEAALTTVLSPAWRKAGPTRPNFDFCGICDECQKSRRLGEADHLCKSCYRCREEAFLPVVDTILQGYRDKDSFPKEIRLRMMKVDPETISLLEKWIPFLTKARVETFDIGFGDIPFWVSTLPRVYFDFPLQVFHVESLEKLYLQRCSLSHFVFDDFRVIQFDLLETLSLRRVLIDDESFEKIISKCPSILNLTLDWCEGLRTVRMKHPTLKLFFISFFPEVDFESPSLEIDDAPALHSIEIIACPNWYLPSNFPTLNSLVLNNVHVPSSFFDNFSSKFPLLEKLDVSDFIPSKEFGFHLSSDTIEDLTFSFLDSSATITIHAPKLRCFEIRGAFPPSQLSFTAIPTQCKSVVDMWYCGEDGQMDVKLWFENLHKLLSGLGKSQITVNTCHDCLPDNETIGVFDEPVSVGNLGLSLQSVYSDSSPEFLNSLFCICRPSYANVLCWDDGYVDFEFVKFLYKALVKGREKGVYEWQNKLEEVRMEIRDKDAKEWQNRTTLEEYRLLTEEKNQAKLRFRLKWRD